MPHSFTQRFLLMVAAGFAAAVLFWFFRHVIQSSMDESGQDWRKMYKDAPARKY